jgi:TRAP-type C4-dicarboxylate transport system permease small subunit
VGALLGLARALGAIIAPVLTVGRWIGGALLGAMTVIILLQVFFRYVLGSALAWPEEASRFFMLWSCGLMAPTAFRRGGFVAIEMFVAMLPRRLAALLYTALLALVIVILLTAVQIAFREVTGLGGRFATDSLWLWLPGVEGNWFKVPKAWMMTSMLVGVALLLVVSVELLVRSVIVFLGHGDDLAAIPDTVVLGSE